MPRMDPTLARDVPFLPRWLPWSYALILILTLSFWSMSLLKQASLLGYVYRRDFSSVYVGARIAADGRGSQLYNLEVQRNLMNAVIAPYSRRNLLPYIYPAYVAVLLSPLGKLSLGKAFLVWTGINFLATAWIARHLIQYYFGSARQ